MLEKWREGFEVVYTIRDDDRAVPFFKRTTARLFYGLINLIAEVRVQEGTADFRLLDRSVVDVLKTMNESSPFYRGIVPWTGFRQTGLHFKPLPRNAGRFLRSLRPGFLQHHAPAPGYVSGFCHGPDRFHRRSEGGDRVPVYEQYG